MGWDGGYGQGRAVRRVEYAEQAALGDQLQYDASQADADAAMGITPPPMVSAAGGFIPGQAIQGVFAPAMAQAQAYGDSRFRGGYGGRRFHGDMGAETTLAEITVTGQTAGAPLPPNAHPNTPAPPSADAAALQLAGAAIGLGAQGLPAADKSSAIGVAAQHPHSLAGLVKVGAGNYFHKVEAFFHTLIYPSKKDATTGVTTLAPVAIKG
jgi:hypothetical protein